MPAEAPKTPRNGPERKTLSPTVISKLSTAGERVTWDKEAPRLAVRCRANGSKIFLFISSFCWKQIKVSLGDARGADHDRIEQARTEARRLQALIDAGTDPREVLKAEDAAREAKATAEAPAIEAWRAYLTDRRDDWGERHMRNHEAFSCPGGKPKTRGRRPGESATTQPGPLHALLQRPLSEITPAAVRAWLEEGNKTRPTWTAQAYRALRAFIGWCAASEAYAPVTHPNACTAPETRRKVATGQTKDDDCLQREMLRPWFEQVRKIGNPIQAAYLQALLLTGARREELAGLRWEDVDFQWESMTIRDKVEGERTIPLTPYVASSLLGPLARRNEWVFSAPAAKSGRIAEPRIAHIKALSAAGLPHVSLHGLRRSFGTLSEWVECPAGVTAQIMGHKPSAIAEKHYRRRPLDLLRAWHVKIEGWILEQAGIEKPAENTKNIRAVS
jgi:integrase